jgi:hypothetical protein
MENITADASKHRVNIEFVGTYSGDIARFSEEIKSKARIAKGGGQHFDMISDFTQSHVIPQNLAGASAEVAEWCGDNGLRKSANVVNSMLLKLQLDRLTPDGRFKTFLSREEAEAWLDE